MASLNPESVEDPEGLLAQPDHMRDMDRVMLEVVAILCPFPSVARVVGRIDAHDPQAWGAANVAVRIEVETPRGNARSRASTRSAALTRVPARSKSTS
ncbi:hypothetical protein ACFSS8_13250 [Paracoccus kondratievae]